VPNEAAPIVRALLTADKNQFHTRARMSDEQRAATPEVDFRPFIIADADTGHGGDAARAQPRAALRRGRRARLPHRGPEARA
jgi:isocitrate lyase